MRRERAVVELTLLAALATIVLARHAASGPVVRTVALGKSPINVVVDPRTGHAFVATFTPIDRYGHVSLLDARSGALVRTVAAGFDPLAMTVDGQAGRVFVANFRDTTVNVLDARSGALLRSVVVGIDPGPMAVDKRTGRVFVATAMHSVSVLDARSGSVVSTISVGGSLTAVGIEMFFVTPLDGAVTPLDGARPFRIRLSAPTALTAPTVCGLVRTDNL
jgi:DNA-binding beta-propeller fold protein YncE